MLKGIFNSLIRCSESFFQVFLRQKSVTLLKGAIPIKVVFLLFLIAMILTCSASIASDMDLSIHAYVNDYTSDGVAGDEQEAPKEVIIVIDPGHGGEELGTCYGKMYEKNVNLDISLRMGELLKKEEMKIAYTREEDVYVGLQERAEFANDLDATLFISVHNNHMPEQPDYKGTETLYCPPVNPVFDSMDGTKLAKIVQKELVTTLKTYDNGIIYRPNLAVIRRTRMPAVIAEIAYMSNASDRAKLNSADFRQKAGQALANAVMIAIDEMGAYRDEESGKLVVK